VPEVAAEQVAVAVREQDQVPGRELDRRGVSVTARITSLLDLPAALA